MDPTQLPVRRPARLAAAALLAAVAALPACAPGQVGSPYSAAGVGSAAAVSYGTIVGTRPVTVRGGGGGVGGLGGALAGGLAGSFIGGDPRSNIIAGLGGALLGGLAGNALERGVTTGQAVEFVVREDQGGDIAVVQPNPDNLQAGDRVVVSRGDGVRLARAAGGPPPGYAAPQAAPQAGYAPGYAPATGYAPGYGAPAASGYRPELRSDYEAPAYQGRAYQGSAAAYAPVPTPTYPAGSTLRY